MNLEDDKNTVQHLFTHPSFGDRDILPPTLPGGSKSPLYVNPDAHSRKVHEQALTGMFGNAFFDFIFFEHPTKNDKLYQLKEKLQIKLYQSKEKLEPTQLHH